MNQDTVIQLLSNEEESKQPMKRENIGQQNIEEIIEYQQYALTQ